LSAASSNLTTRQESHSMASDSSGQLKDGVTLLKQVDRRDFLTTACSFWKSWKIQFFKDIF